MSGHGTEETVAKTLQLGASDFITKPMSLESLLDPIQDVSEKIEAKVIQVQPGKAISVAFYETICIYPGKKDLLLYLRGFCSERFFRVIVAQIWTDVLAVPAFIAIIEPSRVKKRDWSMLFDYLTEIPDTMERFALLSKAHRPRIPKALRKFFKIIEDRSGLEEYILYRSKKALRRMKLKQKAAFMYRRRRDVKMILGKRGFQREFFVMKFARYYNVTPM